MGPSTFLKFIFLLICLLACPFAVSALETYTDEELDAMSDEELELICIVRGFELVKDHVDEQTGEVYTLQHEDYIMAAKQCLSIESEMNEILEEHPELREELEEEIIKMQQEQEERRAELEKLQQQLEESDADDSDATLESTAFVGKPELDHVQEEKADDSAATEREERHTAEDEALREEIEEEVAEEDSSISGEDQPDVESSPQSTTDKMEGLEVSDEERIPLNEHEEAALAEQKEMSEEITLEYLRVEFIKYVKKDIERLTRILFPILQPMVNAGDLAIRYIRAALSALRDAYSTQANPNE